MKADRDVLMQAYKNWKLNFPGTVVDFTSRTKNRDFWEKAANQCENAGISENLLIYTVYAYSNANGADAYVPFRSSVFRSDVVMERAISNAFYSFRSVTKEQQMLRELIDQREDPKGLTDAFRLQARLSLAYFEEMVDAKMESCAWLPDQIRDGIVFTLCEKNPFLLLHAARTPRMRALAAVNALYLADVHPWHFDIWDGIACKHSIRELATNAGSDYQSFYADGKIAEHWPANPLSCEPFHVFETAVVEKHPTLKLFRPALCARTDFRLAVRHHMATTRQ
jgi:hypothetical protein